MSYAAGVGAGGGIAFLGVIAGALLSKRQTSARMEEFLGDINALKPALAENFERVDEAMDGLSEELGALMETSRNLAKGYEGLQGEVTELAQTSITRDNLDQVARQIAEGEAARTAVMQRPAPVFASPAPPVPPAQQQWREAPQAQIDEAVNARLRALQEQMRQAESAFSDSR